MSWEAIGKVGAVAVSALAAILTFWKGRKNDKALEKSGAAANGRAGITQNFEILNGIIDNLQEDRDDERAIKIELRKELSACSTRVGELTRRLERYERRFGPLK
jgi:flagellar basal body-associated protein FliL